MKTLIHTALLPEAQFLINFLKLKQDFTVQKLYNIPSNMKLFTNDDIILLVSGMGKTNTLTSLSFVFKHFAIKKAINIGIVGCKDKSIKIGTLFCTTKNCVNVENASITTVDKPLDNKENLKTMLVDMESSHFHEECSKYINEIYILKVVSDHLDITIPKKAFVIELIKNSYKLWKKIL